MFELYDIKNVNDFAKIVFQGKLPWGSITKYNDAWKQFAKNNEQAQIHFVSYEDLSNNTARNVAEIVQFLDLKNIDISRVVAGSKIDVKDEYFKTQNDVDFKEDVEHNHLVKRTGKIDSWKNELTEFSLKYYRMYFE